MNKLIVALMMGCLVASESWGKSFSVDLHRPAAKALTQTVAKLKSVSGDSEFLRKVNLDAGSANVGKVAVGDEISFTLFDDVRVALTLKTQMPSPLGGDVFLAEASGCDCVKNAVVLRTVDGLMVDIHDYRKKKVYKVISTATGVTVLDLEAKGCTCGCDALKPAKLKSMV